MTNFLVHLTKAILDKKLSRIQSKLGDWFCLLDSEQIDELSTLTENLPDNMYNTETISLLVYNLCLLEGIKVDQDYKGIFLAQTIKKFTFMVRLEKFQRQQHIKVRNGISFLFDPEIVVLQQSITPKSVEYSNQGGQRY